MAQPLMPKATAVWLVENTSLTFEQIGDFCGLHVLEVKGIADGDVAQGIKGLDPVANGQLMREEIERCSADPSARLKMLESGIQVPERRPTGQRYTPLSKRQDRPNAIAWLIRYQTELTDAQIAKLVGTTKPTIQSVRDRSHWNMVNIKPQDPVTLGLCSQTDLDEAVRTAQAREARRREREQKAQAKAKAEQLAAAEAADMPSTRPVPEEEPEAPPEQTPDETPAERSPTSEAPGENVSEDSRESEPRLDPADVFADETR